MGVAGSGSGSASDGWDGATDADVHPLIRYLLEYQPPPPTRRNSSRKVGPSCNPFTGEPDQADGPEAVPT